MMNLYQFNILIRTTGLPYMQMVHTDINLLELYKSAVIGKADSICWEKGMITMDSVAGILDITPPNIGGNKI